MSESFLKASIAEDEEESYLIFSPVLTWQQEWQLIPELAELPYSATGLGVLSTIPLSGSVFPAIGIRRVFASWRVCRTLDRKSLILISFRRSGVVGAVYTGAVVRSCNGCKYVRDEQSKLQADEKQTL